MRFFSNLPSPFYNDNQCFQYSLWRCNWNSTLSTKYAIRPSQCFNLNTFRNHRLIVSRARLLCRDHTHLVASPMYLTESFFRSATAQCIQLSGTKQRLKWHISKIWKWHSKCRSWFRYHNWTQIQDIMYKCIEVIPYSAQAGPGFDVFWKTESGNSDYGNMHEIPGATVAIGMKLTTCVESHRKLCHRYADSMPAADTFAFRPWKVINELLSPNRYVPIGSYEYCTMGSGVLFHDSCYCERFHLIVAQFCIHNVWHWRVRIGADVRCAWAESSPHTSICIDFASRTFRFSVTRRVHRIDHK